MSANLVQFSGAQLCECCRVPARDCRVMAELRQLSTPEGRDAAMEAYREELRKAAARREGGPTPQQVRERLGEAGVPAYVLNNLDKPLQPLPALKAARQFVRDREAVFLSLMGSVGTGKTTAAALVLREAVRAFPWDKLPSGSGVMREPCRFVAASRFTGLSAFDEGDKEFFERCLRVPLLCVDDFGEEPTMFGKARVAELLNERHAHLRRTIVTSNAKPDEITTRYGDKLADRLREGAVGLVLEGPSLRKSRGTP